MEEIRRHLEKIGYSEYSVNLNIKAELYLRRKVKEIFNIDTILSSEKILIKLQQYFEKDKIMQGIIERMELFPKVKSYIKSDYYITFTLTTGSFYKILGNNFDYLSNNNFSAKNLISLVEKFQQHYLLGDNIEIYNITKPLKCVMFSENYGYDLPNLNDQNPFALPLSLDQFNQKMIEQKIDLVMYQNKIALNPESLSSFKIIKYKINDKFLHLNFYKFNNHSINYKNYYAFSKDIMNTGIYKIFDIFKICNKSEKQGISLKNIISKEVFIKIK